LEGIQITIQQGNNYSSPKISEPVCNAGITQDFFRNLERALPFLLEEGGTVTKFQVVLKNHEKSHSPI
jgi:hypothetical protein